MSSLVKAQEYWERGLSVIPILPGKKKPAIKWRDYQDRQPTEAEIIEWWERWPTAGIALVTGEVSGVVVVDCDNEEAVKAADDLGMISPIRVKTPRGEHRYFEHPRDGERRGPRAGGNSTGTDWPKVNGLDFRGDGSLRPRYTNLGCSLILDCPGTQLASGSYYTCCPVRPALNAQARRDAHSAFLPARRYPFHTQ